MNKPSGFISHLILIPFLLIVMILTAVAIISGPTSVGIRAVSEPCERLSPLVNFNKNNFVVAPGSETIEFSITVKNRDMGICPGSLGYYVQYYNVLIQLNGTTQTYLGDAVVLRVPNTNSNYFTLSQNEEKTLTLNLDFQRVMPNGNYIYPLFLDPGPDWMPAEGHNLNFTIGNVATPSSTPRPTPSPTPSPRPTGTGTPRPTPTPVNVPQITSLKLPYGIVGRSYRTVIESTDKGQGTLTMSITNLPSGLGQGECKTSVNPSKVQCAIVGKPNKAGVSSVVVSVKDSDGNITRRDLRLVVKRFWWIPSWFF